MPRFVRDSLAHFSIFLFQPVLRTTLRGTAQPVTDRLQDRSPVFGKVIATDASAEQVASAEPARGVEYRVASAEACGIEQESVDLITVAQALHWFDVDSFFAEASRVLRPGGILAFWCYHNCRVTDACDEIIDTIFEAVDAHWPRETRIVNNRYRDIPMPFAELPVEAFSMTANWTADNTLAYMRTWSASQRYMTENGEDPCVALADELKSRWGDSRRIVSWPLAVRVMAEADI